MELTSPLTTAASISTPESFHTAHDSPSNAGDETTLSSPVEEYADDDGDGPDYRDAMQLPRELKSHCQIHMEEQLYTAAIHILSGLLSDGNSVSPGPIPNSSRRHQKQKPARVPPPSQLALLATLIIHPSFTSRPPETDNLHAAAHALTYLRSLLAIVGPVNANLRAAFAFNKTRTAHHHHHHYYRNSNPSSPSPSPFSTPSSSSSSSSDLILSGPFARSQLLFDRAADFWAVLGWAFRCAAELPHRWRHWRAWLDVAVGALEADFDERLARDRRQGRAARGKTPRPYPLLRGSLVAAYLADLSRERKNVPREVMRALFAFVDERDAGGDRAVFREVFEREAVVGRPGKSKRKRAAEEAVVDLENDQFGDYLDGEESEEEGEAEEGGEVVGVASTASARRPRRKSGRKPKGEGTATFSLTDDVAESVPFRLRIFRLLSATSYYLPGTFVPIDELYKRFTDHIRGLPLPLFRVFIASHPPLLPRDAQVTLLRAVIEELLPRHHPDPDAESEHGVTVRMLEKCFLPFAANRVTAEDNAKLSLALESMLWFVYSQIEVAYSDGLRRAVETGIKAREDKIRRKGAAALKADAADKAAREALARSARNLRALVGVMAVAGK